MTSKLSRFRLALTSSVVLWATIVCVPVALAHSHPVTLEPAKDSTVASPPAVIVHFSEPLEPKFSSLDVTDAKGHHANAGQSKVDASDKKLMTLTLPTLAPGTYTVHWVSVAEDGHRLEGTYDFTVK